MFHNWSVSPLQITNGRDIVSRVSHGSVQNMTKMILHICENTRDSKLNKRYQDIKGTVKDAKKICDEANNIGKCHKGLSCEEVYNVVHDAAEFLECLLDENEEALSDDEESNPSRQFSSNDTGDYCSYKVDIPPNGQVEQMKDESAKELKRDSRTRIKRNEESSFVDGMEGARRPLL